jgi:parallel beta-helix repeat protein
MPIIKKVSAAVITLLIITISPIAFMQVTPANAQSPRTITVPYDYTTIQAAINAASDGDTVLVSAGRYYEGIQVNKSVTVVGESPSTTTVYGTVEGYASGGVGNPFQVSADNVVIANLSIVDGDEYNGAIKAVSSKNVAIRNNVITQGGYSGIAVAMTNCVDFSVIGNTITQGGGRIDIQGSRIGEIAENKLSSLEYSIIVRNSPNITFTENSISQCDEGIQVTDSANSTFNQNRISSVIGAISGISLSRCPGSLFAGNVAVNCTSGISLSESCCCVLRDNSISGRGYYGWGGSSFGVFGYELGDFILDIDTSNTIDGKAIYYLANKQDVAVTPLTYPNAGYLALINCTRTTVEGFSLGNCSQGILLAKTTNSQIKNNTVSNSDEGISLQYHSDNNLIYGNTFEANSQSIHTYYSSSNTIISNDIADSGTVWLDTSSNYTILGNDLGGFKLVQADNILAYHNNFLKSSYYLGEHYTSNVGYPTGGSYHIDYFYGKDLKSGISQGVLGPDGIGDTAYYTDYYPLIAPIRLCDAGNWRGIHVYVELESNSTLSNFEIDSSRHTIAFSAFGNLESIGFCRVGIPKIISQEAWGGQYQIVVNGKPCQFTTFADAQNEYNYVSYTNLPATIIQSPSPSVPEFPNWIILALIAVVAVVTVYVVRRRTA